MCPKTPPGSILICTLSVLKAVLLMNAKKLKFWLTHMDLGISNCFSVYLKSRIEHPEKSLNDEINA